MLLVHPGGPLWRAKDEGAWSIPKGEYDPDAEEAFDAASREFAEELGQPLPGGDPIWLGDVTQKAGKVVSAWAIEGDLDADSITSNTFVTEWPPRSAVMREFPEVDRAEWFSIDRARRAINPAQAAFVERLVEALA